MKQFSGSKYYWLTAIHIMLFWSQYAYAQEPKISTNCTIDSFSEYSNEKIEAFQRKTIKIYELSTEGTDIDIYRSEGKLKIIKARLFGESGKLEITYYLGAKKDQYLVRYIKTNYSGFIYEKEMYIASTSDSKFVVCGDTKPNYPNADTFDEKYRNAISVFNKIQKNVNRNSQ